MSDNLQALDTLITRKAKDQAIDEWESLLDKVHKWATDHPVAPATITIHGGRTAKHLTACERNPVVPEVIDGMRALCAGVNKLSSVFIDARTKVIAGEMADELVRKAATLP